ncbi:MAG: hypothetical protein RMK84_02000 [Oscillochloridaceae bacterium]|nr:hypothetical protein [Chloroflexaceae bacterium]MDW8388874.1 hypothetical protein [Oscillochloridaceae bacterium]
MRWLSLWLLVPLLIACGAERRARPTPLPAPTTPALSAVLAAATPGPVRTFGYLLISHEGATLVEGVSMAPDGSPVPLVPEGLWLGDPPPLPDEPALDEAGAVRYGIVNASGILAGPGRFGPEGRYSYRLSDPRIIPLGLREVTIALLLENSGLYEGQAVRVRGDLLARGDAAVLVERLGPGGVPEAAARQIKLDGPVRDSGALAALHTNPGNKVRFGPVEITGVWRGGRLYPLNVRVR